MSLNNTIAELFKGFSKLNRHERLQRLVTMGALTLDDVCYLEQSVDQTITELAENFVENVIGCFPLPLGVATNFKIDGRDYAIPMAVEETSIIAAASRTARWIRETGNITTEAIGKRIIGQIQLAKIKDFTRFKSIIEREQQNLIELANKHVVSGLKMRGGGVTELQLRCIERPDKDHMAVLHVLLDPCDAMGANIISQVCEFLKEPVQQLTGEKVTMCILSNLNDTKLVRAKITIHQIAPDEGNAIVEASLFAEQDPYRAATHNKGVLNGIDPVVIATGNDWRAVEAGIHAYAARSGRYQAITRWRMEQNDLVGIFEAPLCVGTIGGVTRLHPTAKLCLQMLDVTSAEQLARVIAAVGLAQNLGALHALTSEGIVKGHMKLHVNNLLLATDATGEEKPFLKQQMEQFLTANAKITLTDAQNLLAQLRGSDRWHNSV